MWSQTLQTRVVNLSTGKLIKDSILEFQENKLLDIPIMGDIGTKFEMNHFSKE